MIFQREAIDAPAAEEMCEISDGVLAPLTCEDFETATLPLPPEEMPPDYFSPGAAEPGMGNHLLDMTAPELSGEPFTQTWIFGTWAGEMSFFEPMITTAYLKTL